MVLGFPRDGRISHEPPPRADRHDPRRGRARRPRRLPQRHRGHAAARRGQRPLRGRGLPPALSRPGQPGLTPWRLALVTVFQFLEHLSGRQAADAVRARIDWKYALGLELTDPGFHFSVLGEFRDRLVAGGAEHLLLDTMLERFKARGLVKARGKQRTDSTHVLAAVRDLSFLELVAETLRAALDDVAAVAPDWLRAGAKPGWCERYGRRVEDYRLPKSREERDTLALEVGADGFVLLDALDAPDAPAAAREVT